jgi:hypothetical protein
MKFPPILKSPILKSMLLTALFVAVAAFSFAGLRSEGQRSPRAGDETLYLPSGRGLKFMSFGYRNAVAGLFWLDTVSYFGRHYATDQEYRWLGHRCDLVTMLNPQVYDPYYFCSTMLAWETNQPQLAVMLLSKGMAAHPNDWFFPYLRGFYYMYFLKQTEAAKGDFVTASTKPNAHPIAARLAAKKISELDDPETAISFLRGMIQSSRDEFQRSELQSKLQELLKQREISKEKLP